MDDFGRSSLARLIAPRGGEAVNDLGVPHRVHYWLLAAFAVSVASGPLAFSLGSGSEELRNPLTQSLCVGGLLFAPFVVVAGRRTGYVFKDWIFQAAMFFALAGTFLSNLVTPTMIAPFMALYMLAPVGGAFYLPPRKVLPLAAGSVAAILYMSTRVDDPDAMLRGMILSLVAIGIAVIAAQMNRRLRRAIDVNREISERDPLTGAHNLRRFEAGLAEEIARAARGGEGFALLMFDLDNFKLVNDEYSHSVGDDVLIAAADAIRASIDAADLLVRRGGDEFAVLMPLAEGRDPGPVVEMARRRIERARREICPSLTPYASGGWIVHRRGESAAEAMARADAALHEAKATAPERRGHRPSAATSRSESAPTILSTSTASRRSGDKLHDDPIAGLVRVVVRTAAWVIVATCAIISAMTLAGETAIEVSGVGLALVAAWSAVFVPVAVWAGSRRRRPPYVKHVLAAATFVLFALACAAVGPSAPAMLDLLIFAVLVFVVLMPFRYAALYLTAGMVLYGYYLFANEYPYAEIRLAIAASNLALITLVLSITRHHTVLAAREKAKLARTDVLTGLPNTRRLNDRIADEIRRCEVTGDGFALVMLDLDEFKLVNDRHSHSVGDRQLAAVADAIRDVSRHADMPARRGGDEFAVVMTGAGLDDARFAADRIATAIIGARRRIVADVNPGASVGWVVWRPGQDADDLLRRADAALHDAKAAARRTRERPADLATG